MKPVKGRRDEWALAFAIFFFGFIPLSFVAVWITHSAALFFAVLLFNATATLFVAWRRGDLERATRSDH